MTKRTRIICAVVSILIIFVLMLLPLDDRLLKQIKKNTENTYNSGISNQPPLGRDYSLNPTDYTYNADNIIQTTESEILRWGIGDKIALLQNSIQKYFYIVGIDTVNLRLRIVGRGSVTFTNHTINELRISTRVQGPVGFPDYFDYAVTGFTNGTPNTLSIVGDDTLYFIIYGNIVKIFGGLQIKIPSTGSTSSPVGTIYITLPFPLTDTTSRRQRALNSSQGFLDQNASLIFPIGVSIDGFDENTFALYASNFEGFDDQTFDVFLTFDYVSASASTD